MAESEADTPSTPIEFESKYFEFDGVRLPPFCRGKMEEIANFSLRSSDIWIVTYPKSGKQYWQVLILCNTLVQYPHKRMQGLRFSPYCVVCNKRNCLQLSPYKFMIALCSELHWPIREGHQCLPLSKRSLQQAKCCDRLAGLGTFTNRQQSDFVAVMAAH